jgi:hypothetical protein
MNPTTYQEVEAKRGRKSFEPLRSFMFRGKPCDLQRHFKRNTLLREMAGHIELLAGNDRTGRRFIYETKWKKFLKAGYSQSAIDRAERIFESAGILTASHDTVKGKTLPGWIVIDHDKNRTLVENGTVCCLNVELNEKPPRRKRGERRWKLQDAESPYQSPFPQEESPYQSPYKSPFLSPFLLDSESISSTDKPISNQEVAETDPAKTPSESCQSCKSYESKEEESCKSRETQTPPALFLESKSDERQNPRARKKLTVADVLASADVVRLSDEEFDDRFMSDYPHATELQDCIRQVIYESLSDPYLGRQTNVRLMRRVMNLLKKEHGCSVPRGWIPVIEKLKKDSVVRACRSDLDEPFPEEIFRHSLSAIRAADYRAGARIAQLTKEDGKQMILKETCPEHKCSMVSNANKKSLIGKCVWKHCSWGILKSSPTEIQDVGAVNDPNVEDLC